MNATPDEPVLILGNGGMGTALSLILHQTGATVRVWGFETDYTREMERVRRNPKFLPGIEIPRPIRFSPEIEELTPGVETIVSVIPTQFLRRTLEKLRPHLPEEALVISCSKGFERSTLELPSRVIAEVLPRSRVGVLSGPSHAEEIARGLPTTVVVAAEDPERSRFIQGLFHSPSFRAYTSGDPLGVEIAGASKNVIALAAGIADGLGFGDNARAALICRGASEITRIGSTLGAQPETFAGLSGIGDLVVTCTSEHSRNRSVGLRLGRGESLGDILRSTEMVAEGVETTRSLHQLAAKLRVELPITREVYAVLFEGKDARQAVADLMGREPKDEASPSG